MLDRMLDSETRERDLGVEASPPCLVSSVVAGPGFDSMSPQRSSKQETHCDAAFEVTMAFSLFCRFPVTTKDDQVL